MDGASAIITFVGFSAGCFEACIKGLILLSKARSYGRDASGVGLMLELEYHKLRAWGEEVGLSNQPPELFVDARYVQVVYGVLQHLRDLFFDLEKLKQNYGLELQETSDDLDEIVDRLKIDPNDGSEQVATRIFKQRKQPWKVLKWVTFDEQRVRKLLDQVKFFTNELQQILDRTRQAKLSSQNDMLLRNAILGTENAQDLAMIWVSDKSDKSPQIIAAAALLKQRGLRLGIMDIDEPPASPGRPPSRSDSSPRLTVRYTNAELAQTRLSARSFELRDYRGSEVRCLARYEGEPVMLEFKNESGIEQEAMKDRMSKVSTFLRNLDQSFHGLPCLGYVKLWDRYAYAFKIVNGSTPKASGQPPSYRTLRDLMEQVESPSINLRISFAITILETLLQLHTSGWLHKELRSDNILFFLDREERAPDFLNSPMYIAGYAYARADQPQEFTDPPESEIEADLYRHPASLRQPPERFRRAFDMFSVGCILLEIGLWCSMSALFRTASAQPTTGEKQAFNLLKVRQELLFSPGIRNGPNVRSKPSLALSAQISHKLQAATGQAYTEIVEDFIYASEELKRGVFATRLMGLDEDKSLLRLEMSTLEKLRAMAEVL